MAKALVLFSGGLDSRLVIKILQEQGVEIFAVIFKLPFECNFLNKKSIDFIKKCKINYKTIDCTKGKNFDYFINIIKQPKYGTGSGINPCIDCRIFILNYAKSLLKKYKCDFIATGEVLGQRPMSQHKHALELIDKKTELSGKVLRPLSAKLLPETEAENRNFIKREKLFGIIGKNRRKQIKLAKKYKISYPNPAGGCLLCEKKYAKKFRDFIENNKKEKIEPKDILILKGFRHFRSTVNRSKLIIGRNQEENNLLKKLNKSLDYNLIIPKIPGPTCLYENKKDKNIAKKLVKAYSSKDLNLRQKFEGLKI